MAGGVALLGEDADLLDAFRVANRGRCARPAPALGEKIGPDGPSWRPFQLAFLLLNLPGLADPHDVHRETVDLLFFPTGGGKTEATWVWPPLRWCSAGRPSPLRPRMFGVDEPIYLPAAVGIPDRDGGQVRRAAVGGGRPARCSAGPTASIETDSRCRRPRAKRAPPLFLDQELHVFSAVVAVHRSSGRRQAPGLRRSGACSC